MFKFLQGEPLWNQTCFRIGHSKYVRGVERRDLVLQKGQNFVFTVKFGYSWNSTFYLSYFWASDKSFWLVLMMCNRTSSEANFPTLSKPNRQNLSYKSLHLPYNAKQDLVFPSWRYFCQKVQNFIGMKPLCNFISQYIHFLSAWVTLFQQHTQKRAVVANCTRTEIPNFNGMKPVVNFWSLNWI